jgi:hypothetical protein
MKLGLLEDGELYSLAQQVVPAGGSGVENAQVSGLLSTVRASRSYAVLHDMTQRQRDKARKDGDRGAERAAFYDRLLKALQNVEKRADEYVRASYPLVGGKADRNQKERWSGRLAATLMTHVAAEHRWQGSRR